MKQIVRTVVVMTIVATTAFLLFAANASAVPSFSRRYGMECSGCHTMWGALNATGITFRLSGYRAINGADLPPQVKDIEIANGVMIPATLPLSMITGVGFDYRRESRTASNGTTNTKTGSSIDLEDASIFLTSPIGPHLSVFMEFPM